MVYEKIPSMETSGTLNSEREHFELIFTRDQAIYLSY